MVRGYEIGRNPSVSKHDVTDAIKRADSYNSYTGTDHRHYAGETTRNFRGQRKVFKIHVFLNQKFGSGNSGFSEYLSKPN